MPPKTAQKKRAPVYGTGEAELQPYGVKAGGLVHTALGCTVTVLGIRAAMAGDTPQLWVRYRNGLEAPVQAAGLRCCSAVEQLQADIAKRQREQQELDAKWRVYNAQQEGKVAAARQVTARKKTKPATAAAAGAAAEQQGAADAMA